MSLNVSDICSRDFDVMTDFEVVADCEVIPFAAVKPFAVCDVMPFVIAAAVIDRVAIVKAAGWDVVVVVVVKVRPGLR